MEFPHAVACNKALSDVSSKSDEEMDHSLVVGEAPGHDSSKDLKEKVGVISVVPGGSLIKGANDCDELNPEVNSSNLNNEVVPPPVTLVTSRDSPKGVNLDESNLQAKSSKAKDEAPLIVLDPTDESSKGENLDEPACTNTDGIPLSVQDPLQDSAKEEGLDESNVEVPPVEPEASEVANAGQIGDEFGCKYCHRKFTNKQSLGGHQNAHKYERAMEKESSLEAHEPGAGYFKGSSSYSRVNSYLASHRGSLKRPYEYVDRPLQISYQSQLMLQYQGTHVARPVQPRVLPQAVPRHFHDFYRGYHPGWTVPAVPTVPSVPRVSQFVTAQPSYIPSVALTLQFQNPGAPNYSSRTVSQALSAFPESRSVPGRNAGVQNNNQIDVPGNEEDDSSLDLTLKL